MVAFDPKKPSSGIRYNAVNEYKYLFQNDDFVTMQNFFIKIILGFLRQSLMHDLKF